MPGGISNPLLGYAAFCAVKLAGYTLAARVISRAYGRTELNSWGVGAARTVIGMAAGALYGGAALLLANSFAKAGSLVFLAGFIPIRLAEWWLLLWLFYDRPLADKRKGWCVVGLATVWSYVVDLPAIAGAFFTGGFWIC